MPPLPRIHGVMPRGQAGVSRSSLHEGRFGRMFRSLAPAPHYDLDQLKRLAGSMRERGGGPRGDNPDIPAGYTYFGQFLDHDITFDASSRLQVHNDPDALVDFRTPRYDLDMELLGAAQVGLGRMELTPEGVEHTAVAQQPCLPLAIARAAQPNDRLAVARQRQVVLTEPLQHERSAHQQPCPRRAAESLAGAIRLGQRLRKPAPQGQRGGEVQPGLGHERAEPSALSETHGPAQLADRVADLGRLGGDEPEGTPEGPSPPAGVLLVAGPGLPDAVEEVRELCARYPGARCLTGAAATGEAVKAALERAELAHLAAHGSFRSDNPLFSALEFADGPLTVYEIEALGRAPRRLILSACDSARAAVLIGGELLGVSSALFALGTSTVVGSVVPVRDDTARTLMVDFHRRLASGRRPAVALAESQLELAGEEGFPRGAAFVCFGAG